MLPSSRFAWVAVAVFWLLVPVRQVLASVIFAGSSPNHHRHALSAHNSPIHQLQSRGVAPLYHSATSADIAAARALVRESIAKSSILNKARFDRPARNSYHFAPGNGASPMGPVRRTGHSNDRPPPLLRITPEIAKAAALVAEADAMANSTGSPTIKGRAGAGYWMESIARKGSHPLLWGGSSDYKVSGLPLKSHLTMMGFLLTSSLM